MVVVQIVTSVWSKASRGAPGSTARAVVPEAVTVELLPGVRPGAVLVQRVEALETEGFEPVSRSLDVVDGPPLDVAGFRLVGDGDRIVVTRLADIRSGWPSRDRPVRAFTLGPGETGRALRNNRQGAYGGWTYSKVVVNVGFCDGVPTADLFTGVAPTFLLDEQASLR